MPKLIRQLLFNVWLRYERHIRIAVLASGFLTDLYIAKRPDAPLVNMLLLSYLAISALCIILLNRRAQKPEIRTEPILVLLILQFCFGGLAGNMLILYGRSGTPAGDLLFTGFLAAMLIGNEFLKDRYQELRFNVAVYYTLLFTYAIIAAPTFIFHSIGSWVFVGTGIISLVAIALFLRLLSRTALVFHGRTGRRRFFETSMTVGGIFLFFNVLYFSGIIPPVPLALKDVGIYHSIEVRTPTPEDESIYRARFEEAPSWQFWRNVSGVFHTSLGKSAYCYSAVFAPAGLSIPVYHRWEHFDETSGQWTTLLRASFPVAGGRDEGYRGFSAKAITFPGKWRCSVETENGKVIGRADFTATKNATEVSLSERPL